MTVNRIVLGVAYDGSRYQGWQTQPHRQTVQDRLEMALQSFTKQRIQTTCAGRTDAGVHALGQVVHFDTELNRVEYSWVNGVNTFLPDDIAVSWARILPLDAQDPQFFHARFSAYSRTYHYVLHNGPVRSPIWSQRAGWFFRPLDVERMREGAQFLLGEQDFSVFRATGCQAKTPIKTMYELQIHQVDDLIVFSLRASAFLHHMVRNIVGALLYVGSGRREPVWMGELIASKNRSVSAPTFMPDGLYLGEIAYPDQWAIPSRGTQGLPYGLSAILAANT